MPRRSTSSRHPDLAEPFREVIGVPPHQVTLQERVEKGLSLYLRFDHPDKVAKGSNDTRTWKPLNLRARSKLGEALDPVDIARARVEAQVFAGKLAAGELAAARGGVVSPGRPIPGDRDGEGSPPLEPNGQKVAASSFAVGIERYITRSTKDALRARAGRASGNIPRSLKEQHARLRKFAKIMESYVPDEDEAPASFLNFGASHRRFLAQMLAAEQTSGTAGGAGAVVRMVGDVYAAARVLREMKLLGASVCEAPKRWRREVRTEWEKEAGEAAGRREAAPRHTRGEQKAIFAALDDPRPTLCKLLARGTRLSLYAGRLRSHVRLDITAAHPHGGIVVSDSLNSAPYTRGFDCVQRAALDHALTQGWLRELEAAFRTGGIHDYHLFASGPLNAEGERGLVLHPSDAGPPLVAGAGLFGIDPRVRLLLEIGIQARLGQVGRVMRSALHLDALSESPTGTPILVDQVVVAGRGNKRGTPIILHAVSSAALRHELHDGYLRELEAAYVRGEILNYALFPQGRLIEGVASVAKNESYVPATRDALRKWFHELERAAGFEPVKGRAWNGLRRLTMDQAPGETANELTLNTLSSTSTAMRNSRYQNREAEAAALEAAQVAERLRTQHRVAGATPAPTGAALDPHLAARIQALKELPAEALKQLFTLLDTSTGSGAGLLESNGTTERDAPASRQRGRPRKDGTPSGSPRPQR